MTTTDRDAKAQIIRAIEANNTASSKEYDLAAILAETHEFSMPGGYRQVATVEEFWDAVARNEKAPAR